MSAARWPFTALSPMAAEQADAAAHCRQAGVEPIWLRRPAEGAMLKFSIAGDHLELTALVAAESWGPSHWPALAGLAWSELSTLAVLEHFLPHTALLELEEPTLQGMQVDLLGIQTASPNDATQPSPALRSAQGHVWIEHARCVGPVTPHQAVLPHLVVQLDLHIGRLSLPLRRLRALAPGAVLLLYALAPVARIGRTSVCAFDFTLEAFTVTDTFNFLEDDADPAPSIADAAPHKALAQPKQALDVSRLPVTVEVVLCRLPQTVADLAALQPGAVFTLPEGSWKTLQLRVHGQHIARGELVQIGDQLGVQLHQAPDVS